MKRKETPTSDVLTASQPYNTIRYFVNRAASVQYAGEMLRYLSHVSPLTITIEQEKSGDCYVSIATGVSSEDIQTLISSKREQTTSVKALDG